MKYRSKNKLLKHCISLLQYRYIDLLLTEIIFIYLTGKPVVTHLRTQTEDYIQKYSLQGKRVSFFVLTDNPGSWTYVRMKKKYAEKLGLVGEIIDGQGRDLEKVLAEITKRNIDDTCIGIIVQLPLPDHLQAYYAQIVSHVSLDKDLDGLNGLMFGQAAVGVNDFLPATPRAVIEILDYYGFSDVVGKTISVIGQSNLVGKPLAVALMNRGATVSSFNIDSDPTLVADWCEQSDIIISATGKVYLIDEGYFGDSIDLSKKVMIDVGRGSFEGKPAGDINWRYYEDKVAAITPVPGGVGPVTVACLFANMVKLGDI